MSLPVTEAAVMDVIEVMSAVRDDLYSNAEACVIVPVP